MLNFFFPEILVVLLCKFPLQSRRLCFDLEWPFLCGDGEVFSVLMIGIEGVGDEGVSSSIDTSPPSCRLGLCSPSLMGLGNLTVWRPRSPRGWESVFSMYEEVKKLV